MSRSTSVRLRLRVDGLSDPDLASRELGVTPAKAYREGEEIQIGRLRRRARGSAWVSEDVRCEGNSVDQPLRELVRRFWPVRHSLRALAARQGVTVYVSVIVELRQDCECSFPDLYLDSALVAHLSELGAGFDLDVCL